MLVLTRRLNQTIMIGDEIEITVVEVRGDQVRIGINAPKGIRVDRKEIARLRTEEARIAKEKSAG